MSVQKYLLSSYDSIYFDEDVAPNDDMATALTKLTALLVLAGYTNTVGDTWKSPVDLAGRWFEVDLTAPDADTLAMILRDKDGNEICDRHVQINPGVGNPISYFVGSKRFLVMIHRTDAPPWQHLYASLLECSPAADSVAFKSLVGNGTLNNSDADDSNFSYLYDLWMWLEDGGSSERVSRSRAINTTGGTQPALVMVDGTRVEFDVFINNRLNAGDKFWVGRLPNVVVVPKDYLPGEDVQFCIDTDTLAAFRVLGFPVPEGASRFAMRKSLG